MDKRLNKDWTGQVRDRLEKRELKPSDALWERIGEALPQAEPRRVRRLPWGAVTGAAAAAAALAAVLFLRPSGAPEPGRIDVVQTPAAPVAMAGKTDDTMAETEAVTVPTAVTEAVSSRVSENLNRSSENKEGPSLTEETVTVGELPVFVQEQPATVHEQAVADKEQPVKVEEKPANVVKQASTNQAMVNAAEDVRSLTMEEFIAQEEAAKRRHRSLTAAVFATGTPSRAGLGKIVPDIDPLSTAVRQSYPDTDMLDINGSLGNGTANSASNYDKGGSQAGYTNNPESLDGFTPVKYSEDPYNINGLRMNHSKPVSAGLALTVPIGNRLFAESGVYWSYLRSTSAVVSSQSLHSVGIPLKLGYDFGGPGRISFSLSAGAKAEKVVFAARDGVRFKEPGIQLAAVGDAAVRFDITRNLGIFLAPELSYWFTQTNLPTYNTENPLNLSLKAGLNVTLGD
jgi:hypothetical protein